MTVRFITKSDFIECGWVRDVGKTITIKKKHDKIFVSGEEAKMTYNGLGLIFEFVKGGNKHVVYNDKRHSPPKPIAEMYKDLGGT